VITMTEQTPQTTQTAEATPRSGSTVTPTPTQHEIDSFLTAQAAGTLRGTQAQPTWALAPDGSPVAQGAFDPVQKSPTWP
jgi:hypothetical protein